MISLPKEFIESAILDVKVPFSRIKTHGGWFKDTVENIKPKMIVKDHL